MASLGLKTTRHHPVVQLQTSGQNNPTSTLWVRAKLKQKHVIIQDGDFPVADLKPLSELIGRPVAGILGMAFFSKFVVKVDYSQHKISFFDPDRFEYSGDGEAFRLLPSGNTTIPIIAGSVILTNCKKVAVRFAIDSGSNNDVVFNHKFLTEYPSFAATSLDRHNATVGYGTIDGSWGSLQAVTLGKMSITVRDVLALRHDGMDSLNQFADASLGAEVLRHFTATFNIPQGLFILELADSSYKPAASCVIHPSEERE